MIRKKGKCLTKKPSMSSVLASFGKLHSTLMVFGLRNDARMVGIHLLHSYAFHCKIRCKTNSGKSRSRIYIYLKTFQKHLKYFSQGNVSVDEAIKIQAG